MLITCKKNENKEITNNAVVAGKNNESFFDKMFIKPTGNYIIFADALTEQLRESLQANGYDVLVVKNADFTVSKDKATAIFVKQSMNYDSSKENKKEYAKLVERIIKRACGETAKRHTKVVFFNAPVPLDGYFVKAKQRNLDVWLMLDNYYCYAKCNGSDRLEKIIENSLLVFYTGGLASKDDRYLVSIYGQRSNKLNRKE